MPISSWNAITPIMNEVYFLQPKKVLDLGIGHGKFGVLLREVLDAMHGRCRPDQWEARIDGVEAWEAYRTPCWGSYNEVKIEDFGAGIYERPFRGEYSGYDLVLMIDSLEHLEPQHGRDLLGYLVSSNKHVIVSVPVQYMPQGAAYGNEFETHRTHYTGHEFDQYGPTVLNRDMCLTVSMKGRG